MSVLVADDVVLESTIALRLSYIGVSLMRVFGMKMKTHGSLSPEEHPHTSRLSTEKHHNQSYKCIT